MAGRDSKRIRRWQRWNHIVLTMIWIITEFAIDSFNMYVLSQLISFTQSWTMDDNIILENSGKHLSHIILLLSLYRNYTWSPIALDRSLDHNTFFFLFRDIASQTWWCVFEINNIHHTFSPIIDYLRINLNKLVLRTTYLR